MCAGAAGENGGLLVFGGLRLLCSQQLRQRQLCALRVQPGGVLCGLVFALIVLCAPSRELRPTPNGWARAICLFLFCFACSFSSVCGPGLRVIFTTGHALLTLQCIPHLHHCRHSDLSLIRTPHLAAERLAFGASPGGSSVTTSPALH